MPYLDHASTSFPKPPQVAESIIEYLNHFGVSPGRGSYLLSELAERRVEETRELLAKLLKIDNPQNIAFTQNATHSLNLIIKGFLQPNDHALICEYSHNAALRPLDSLRREKNISYDILPVSLDGKIDLSAYDRLKKSTTKLVIATGASNVIGVKADLNELAKRCQNDQIALVLDLTQSILYQERPPEADFYVGTGHKSLLGPPGIGFFYVRNPSQLSPFIEGGSPGNSSLSLYHPSHSPHKFEGGTMNSVGISGLFGALKYIQMQTPEYLVNKAMQLLSKSIDELKQNSAVELYGTTDLNKKIPLLSFNIKGWIAQEAAHEFNNRYNISLRAGLHCAPLMHKKLGTAPTGTIRVSFSHTNTNEEIEHMIDAIKHLSKERNA